MKPAMLLVMVMAFVPLLMPATANAQVETITSTGIANCSLRVDQYQVLLHSNDLDANIRDFPRSVTVHFADGTSHETTGTGSFAIGRQYYYLYDHDKVLRQVPVLYATAQFDTTKYPNYDFRITALPCSPVVEPVTHTVSGDIVQRGNQKPVADLTVCLLEAELCTTTDASGSFAISGLEDGTYTLYTDGDNWKPQYNTVTVSGGDVHIDVTQFKGGGRGN